MFARMGLAIIIWALTIIAINAQAASISTYTQSSEQTYNLLDKE